MDRLRFIAPAVLAVALATPSGRADEKSASDDLTCVLYALADLGNDPDLGQWVAETIPEVIAPGTWKGQGVVRYYAPKKLLVVYHTPATQARVEGFLKEVKKSLPVGNDVAHTAARGPLPTAAVVVPADFRVPGPIRACSSFAEHHSSYPVPAPATRPKHLFHFIIRYEGEGIVDDNVVKAMKTQFKANKDTAGAVPEALRLGVKETKEELPEPSKAKKEDKDDKKKDKEDKDDKAP
jgi:hypothetical protein